MKALIFIQNLKQTLSELETSGENHVFFVETDYQLIQRLKAHAVGRLQGLNIDDQRLRYFSSDLLSRDIFNLRIRYCIVRLREFAIREESYFDYIAKAIGLFIDRSSTHRRSPPKRIEDLLTAEIAKCFEPWYRPDDLFLVDFAQDHQLIFANPRGKNWKITNLGSYFFQLPIFEAIAFLCGLEVVLTLEHHKSSFLSYQLLEELLKLNDGEALSRQSYRLPYSLSLLGVVTGYHGTPQNRRVTDFGYRVLSYVQSHLEQFQNIIMLLLESEATGLKYRGQDDLEESLKTIEGANILIDDQKRSVRTAVIDYESGKCLDSLRVIHPVLEGTLDSALRIIGLQPTELGGMFEKREALEERNLISTKLSVGLEICRAIRNKVVHGNILEEDVELVRPLFPLVLKHLKRLVVELDRSLSEEDRAA